MDDAKRQYQCGEPEQLLCVGPRKVRLAISMAISPISDRVKSLELASTTIVPREMHIEKWAQAKEDMNRLENEISQRASKDDLNRMAFDLLQKIEKKR